MYVFHFVIYVIIIATVNKIRDIQKIHDNKQNYKDLTIKLLLFVLNLIDLNVVNEYLSSARFGKYLKKLKQLIHENKICSFTCANLIDCGADLELILLDIDKLTVKLHVFDNETSETINIKHIQYITKV